MAKVSEQVNLRKGWLCVVLQMTQLMAMAYKSVPQAPQVVQNSVTRTVRDVHRCCVCNVLWVLIRVAVRVDATTG